jgi:hypothetical protein
LQGKGESLTEANKVNEEDWMHFLTANGREWTRILICSGVQRHSRKQPPRPPRSLRKREKELNQGCTPIGSEPSARGTRITSRSGKGAKAQRRSGVEDDDEDENEDDVSADKMMGDKIIRVRCRGYKSCGCGGQDPSRPNRQDWFDRGLRGERGFNAKARAQRRRGWIL